MLCDVYGKILKCQTKIKEIDDTAMQHNLGTYRHSIGCYTIVFLVQGWNLLTLLTTLANCSSKPTDLGTVLTLQPNVAASINHPKRIQTSTNAGR